MEKEAGILWKGEGTGQWYEERKRECKLDKGMWKEGYGERRKVWRMEKGMCVWMNHRFFDVNRHKTSLALFLCA